MEWRELKRNGSFLRYLPEIWDAQLKMPSWFQASSFLWTPAFPVFVEWACDFNEIWGLFDGDDLAMVIYIELQNNGRVAVIHLDVTKRLPSETFIAEASKLRNMLFRRQVKYIRGWALAKNFALRRLMRGIGFRSADFYMDRGSSHGRVLRWALLEIKAA